MPETPKPGTIAWTDLTVPDADAIRDFYTRVTGWKAEPVNMGDYSDYVMVSGAGEGVSGICHSRGPNVNVPPQWLIYIVVEDIDQAVAQCTVFGGEVLDGPRPMSGGMFCVIRDPAGAVCGLYSSPPNE